VLGPGKNQGCCHLIILEQVHEQIGLLSLLDGIEQMGNAFHGARGINLHSNWIMKDIFGKMPNLGWHGRRKNKGLAVFRQLAQYPADIRQKAFVKHVVGLIKDQSFNLTEVNDLIVEKIQKAARACHNDIDPVADPGDLRMFAYTAVNGDATQSGVLDNFTGKLIYLLSKFSGWGKDQRPDLPPWCLHKMLDHRQGKCRGFTSTSLR
jgi:hypothetical protein